MYGKYFAWIAFVVLLALPGVGYADEVDPAGLPTGTATASVTPTATPAGTVTATIAPQTPTSTSGGATPTAGGPTATMGAATSTPVRTTTAGGTVTAAPTNTSGTGPTATRTSGTVPTIVIIIEDDGCQVGPAAGGAWPLLAPALLLFLRRRSR